LEKPLFDTAKEEYQRFESIFRDLNVQVHYLPQEEGLSIDSIYCRDAGIITDYGMILCNMGKKARQNEPFAMKELAKKLDIKILGLISDPGTIEGGDVAWLDTRTLIVGHSYRTNDSGIAQLESLLSSFEVKVIRVDLPHFKGPNDVFHLMSVFSPVAYDVAVVYSPLLPISFRNLLLDRYIRLVEVPPSEFESMGCNVLAIRPGVCLMVEGNPVTQERLENIGCQVIPIKGNEICMKGGGGPTCLTRPLLRKLN
jgi:N-dimethylarginine dimethylaminohydrolase